MTGVRLRGRPRQCPDHVLSAVQEMVYQEKVPYREVCERLNSAGVATPGGGPRWHPSYITRLLRTVGAKEFARVRPGCTATKVNARGLR